MASPTKNEVCTKKRKTNNEVGGASSFSGTPAAVGRWIYDVFLSFHGLDTRKNFVDHLYSSLDQRGIYTFKDDVEFERGKHISELLNVIQRSRFAVVIFSKNYAASTWCLDELEMIMACEKRIGQTVIPVFYDVDPSHVGRQTESYADAFEQHEKSFPEELGLGGKVSRWRKALVEAAEISGLHIRETSSGHEAKCIDQLVNQISSKLDLLISSSGENLVGVKSHIQKVKSLMALWSNDVRFIGIWGMGGIGKSTIAEALFNDIRHHQFEGAYYLSEVGSDTKTHGLKHLQEKLLSSILKGKLVNLSNVRDGINLIIRRLQGKKVLVVLDDLDHMDQLNALAGNHDWFGRGSKIIITTRDKQLLRGVVDETYEVSLLERHEAIKLFSLHAFQKSHPTEEYMDLSCAVVHYTGHLPLALKVMGSALRSRDLCEWEEALQRLKDIPENEIVQKLEISFDRLKDVEKHIFLDIACFFNGMEESGVKRILNSFGFHPDFGIRILIEKSLIVVSEKKLQIHTLLQEMGWYIVRKPAVPGRYSRLWIPEDVCDVLADNLGTNEVEGIALDLFTPKDVKISANAFQTMNRLRYLRVHNACISKDIDYLSNQLRWLNWHRYPSKSLPASFRATKLVGLEMCYSRIIQIWKHPANELLDKLKFIKLSHSHKLIRTPDITRTPNLKELELDHCTSLVEVHESVTDHRKLRVLNLQGCENLKRLPQIVRLDSLIRFNLSGCEKLATFLDRLENMENLLELQLEGTSLKEVPSSIGYLKNLELLNLKNCRNLISLPNSICDLSSLRSLTLEGCSKCENLPENLPESLEELHAGRTAITQPPASIFHLKKLTDLSFSGCRGQAESVSWTRWFLSQLLPGPPQPLISFSLASGGWGSLFSLGHLDISDCNLSESVFPEDFGLLSSLHTLNIGRNNFVKFPGIDRLSRLNVLNLVECKRLERLSGLPPNLFHLTADGCVSLKDCILPKRHRLGWTSIVGCLQLNESIADTLWQFVSQVLSLSLSLSLSCLQLNESIADTLWQFVSQTDDETKFTLLLGTTFPKLFTYRVEGDYISLNLPPKWWSNKFLGFAICCIPAPVSSLKWKSIRLRLEFLNCEDRPKVRYFNSGTFTKESMIKEHVFLVYIPYRKYLAEAIEEEFNGPTNVSQINASLVDVVTKEWGVRLIYKEDTDKEVDQINRSTSIISVDQY